MSQIEMKDSIQSISQQIQDVLKEDDSLASCEQILKSYQNDDWKSYVKFGDKYAKIHLKDCSTDLFDVFIICWNNKQFSTPHDHPDNGCLLKILQGELHEKIFRKDTVGNFKYLYTNIYKEDQIGHRIGRNIIHDIVNTDQQSVSLHIYSPPEYKTNYYSI
jgi:predicted metal-dependent enzyme (double-stranded beta helix superfamily)